MSSWLFIGLAEVLSSWAVYDHVAFVLHRTTCTQAILTEGLDTTSGPSPSLHFEAMRAEPHAGEGYPSVLWNSIPPSNVSIVDRQGGVDIDIRCIPGALMSVDSLMELLDAKLGVVLHR